MSGHEELRVAVNAVASKSGGAFSYARHLIPAIAALNGDLVLFAPEALCAKVRPLGIEAISPPRYAARLGTRLMWEQLLLARRLRDCDALLSIGNFALMRSPIPQAVVHHNALHFVPSGHFRTRHERIRNASERWLATTTWSRAGAVLLLSHAAKDAMSDSHSFRRFVPHVRVSHSGLATGDMLLPKPPLLNCDGCRSKGYYLAVGDWSPHKGLDEVVSAFSVGSMRGHGHLVVVGTPNVRQSRRLMQRVAEDARRSPDIHLAGRVPHSEMGSYYAYAKAYVSAASVESFPLPPLEAMAFGTPAILSLIPPHLEIAGDAALYFDLGDGDRMVAAMKRVEDPIIRRRAISRGGERISRFSWERHAREVLTVLSGLAKVTTP